MTKTAPRVRALNLYTVESDGRPVAQAEAISQAEAVALWVASQQQPVLSARMSTPMEARALAHLPLLSRGAASPAPAPEPKRDPRVPDMFDDLPAAPMLVATGRDCPTCRHDSQGSLAGACVPCLAGPDGTAPMWEPVTVQPGEPAEPVALDASAPAVCDPVQIGETSSPSGLPAEFLGYLEGEEVAAAPQGELVPSALSTAAPTVSPAPAAVELPDADEPTQAERMAGAYAAGVEIARQGHTRWSAEFLDANAAALRGLRGDDADAVHAEMLRGFESGRPESAKPELKRQAEAAAARAGGKIVAKFRDPATGQTWSGRGLSPRWLVQALEAGRTQDEFLIDPA